MCCESLKEALDAKSKANCFSQSTVAEEKGKKFSFNNSVRKGICRVKVDNCLIENKNIPKCDYLFKVCEAEEKNSKYYFVELKGVNVDHAVTQIIKTFEMVRSKLKQSPPENYKGYVISSAVPSATEQKFRKLQDKCLKEHKLSITKRSNQWVEKI